MKLFIVLSVFVVAVSAGGYGGSYGGSNGGASSGVSNQFRSEDAYGNYKFGYDESHASGSTSRHEEETNGVRRGSYSLTDADGRRRTVNYIADHTGFHATVDTNEPGTEAKSPADVIMNGAQPALASTGASGYGSAPAMQTYQQAAPAPRYSAPAAPISYNTYSAPAPMAAARTYSAPAQINTYSAPTGGYSAPLEAPTPRAFSYSTSTTHPAGASYGASFQSAPVSGYSAAPMRSYSAPVAAPARAYAEPTGYSAQVEAPAPRAFNYAFSSEHPSMSFRQVNYNDAPTYSAPAPMRSYGGSY